MAVPLHIALVSLDDRLDEPFVIVPLPDPETEFAEVHVVRTVGELATAAVSVGCDAGSVGFDDGEVVLNISQGQFTISVGCRSQASLVEYCRGLFGERLVSLSDARSAKEVSQTAVNLYGMLIETMEGGE